VDVVGVHRRVLHYDSAAQAGSLLRHGSSTVLWISVQLGHGGLQTVVNLFSSHSLLSHVPKRLDVCWAVLSSGGGRGVQFPDALPMRGSGAGGGLANDTTKEPVRAARQEPVSLDPADVDAAFASRWSFGGGSGGAGVEGGGVSSGAAGTRVGGSSPGGMYGTNTSHGGHGDAHRDGSAGGDTDAAGAKHADDDMNGECCVKGFRGIGIPMCQRSSCCVALCSFRLRVPNARCVTDWLLG
jgi:hypothetical protein